MIGEIVAGPIVRKTTPKAAYIWVATRTELALSGEAYLASKGSSGDHTVGDVVGDGATLDQFRVGANCFIQIVKISPVAGTFPVDVEILYDLKPPVADKSDDDKAEVESTEAGRGLEQLGRLSQITFPGFPLPFFRVARTGGSTRTLLGSCRKLHGEGVDAVCGAETLMFSLIQDGGKKYPTEALFCGDQIYADDVAPQTFVSVLHILESNFDIKPPKVRDRPSRKSLVGDESQFGFTSDQSDFHVITFEEYLALYCLNWNETLWDIRSKSYLATMAALRQFGVSVGSKISMSVRKLQHLIDSGLKGVLSLQRLMANVPCYMIFDDHEVTDDWNLDQKWKRLTEKSCRGHTTIAAALTAYWLCQSWGNDPEGKSNRRFADFIRPILAASKIGLSGEAILKNLPTWSFVTPISDMRVLDLRTQRVFDSNRSVPNDVYTPTSRAGPPKPKKEKRLVDTILSSREALMETIGGVPARPGPLIVVSPTPVFGLAVWENWQKTMNRRLGPYAADLESWQANPESISVLIEVLARHASSNGIVLLAGDVHYSYLATGRLVNKGSPPVSFLQVTSSALKNQWPAGSSSFEALHKQRTFHRSLWKDAKTRAFSLVDGDNSRPEIADLRKQISERLGDASTEMSGKYHPSAFGRNMLTKNAFAVLEFQSGSVDVKLYSVSSDSKPQIASTLRWRASS